MIHLYHGDGKGKTTAAMGLALRAAADGLGIIVCQFLKDGSSGEVRMLAAYDNVTVLHDTPPVKFSFRMNEDERACARTEHDEHLRRCIAALRNGSAQLVILDEAISSLNTGMLDADLMREALGLAAGVREGNELVLTGRNPPEFVVAAADYITQMRCERHPFQQGVPARRGIEF
ncbi:cob(I)yrinic acid a,c-diamide adenosyltransferase [Paratractidigestivibacter sp.]|uniref:cob(I)yrinic acid a,c-diamide adenosyltransferase n=1 Tax=Paratractidigestivibacter sp. TaxID=2847316 RepID=UPI002ABE6A06|nr:cob(I)yrinic acid a,c-diamide adenosyltransferase [Paratractidigestivibacter sp.]